MAQCRFYEFGKLYQNREKNNKVAVCSQRNMFLVRQYHPVQESG